MKFEAARDAREQGFQDGYLNKHQEVIENFNSAYEKGFICGAYERLQERRAKEQNNGQHG